MLKFRSVIASDHDRTLVDFRRSPGQRMGHGGVALCSALPFLDHYLPLILSVSPGSDRSTVESIGQRIRLLRRTAGVSREALAQSLGVHVELLVIVENGDGNPATALNLLKRVESALTPQ